MGTFLVARRILARNGGTCFTLSYASISGGSAMLPTAHPLPRHLQGTFPATEFPHDGGWKTLLSSRCTGILSGATNRIIRWNFFPWAETCREKSACPYGADHRIIPHTDGDVSGSFETGTWHIGRMAKRKRPLTFAGSLGWRVLQVGHSRRRGCISHHASLQPLQRWSRLAGDVPQCLFRNERIRQATFHHSRTGYCPTLGRIPETPIRNPIQFDDWRFGIQRA